MKILDSHVHIFNSRVIENVTRRTELIGRLSLNKEGIRDRLNTAALLDDMGVADVRAALMLPTASVENVVKVNRAFIKLADGAPELFTAGTLHPDYNNIEEELSYLSHADVRVIKFCSFSQGFALDHPGTHEMFRLIRAFNEKAEKPFAVVLDTLTLADRYFGTAPEYTTTPRGVWTLVSRFPEINFIGAHMGGLGADFDDLNRDLQPLENLYLDTSNASYTLSAEQFVQMLQTHGPNHILFGTDWPWFLHRTEVNRIEELMEQAGFSQAEQEAVFSGNLENILGITHAV